MTKLSSRPLGRGCGHQGMGRLTGCRDLQRMHLRRSPLLLAGVPEKEGTCRQSWSSLWAPCCITVMEHKDLWESALLRFCGATLGLSLMKPNFLTVVEAEMFAGLSSSV